MNQKGFSPIILILIVVVLVAGALSYFYFASHTTSGNKVTEVANPTNTSQPEVTQNSVPTPQVTSIPTQSPDKTAPDSNAQILKDIVSSGINCDTEQADGTVLKNTCKVDKVVGNYAKGQMPHAYWIAKKSKTTWKIVVTGNGIPNCEEIDEYSVPKEIYGNCILKSGELRFKME